MSVIWISRLDKAVRETGCKKGLFVTIIVNDFNNHGPHDILSPMELNRCENLIKIKQVDPYLFAQCCWGRGDKVRKYNINIGKVWACLSKSQWRQLEIYYRSLVAVEE